MAVWPYNTPQWAALRALKLRRSPHCEICVKHFKRITAARAVDHIVAVSEGGDPFPPLNQLRSLCIPCHNSKTARLDMGNRKQSAREVKGHDAQGNPFADPNW
jgi:5-methylcytosine-specific restriction enzyme A